MKIDDTTVTGLANLARIELRPEEKAAMVKQLPKILDYVGHLQAVETDAPPAGERIPNAPRADEVRPADHRDAILGQAPERLEDFWRVPPVL